MVTCRECKWGKKGFELITECDHPSNFEFCPIQGKRMHKTNNYRLNGDGQCQNYEERPPRTVKSWWKR